MNALNGIIVKEGWRYIGCALAAALVLAMLDLEPFALLAAAAAGGLVWIYHQPARMPSAGGAGKVIAPCDGKVTAIGREEDGRVSIEIETGCFQTSLLCMPVEGVIRTSKLIRGAMLSRKSPLFEKLNETAELCFEDKTGREVAVRHRLLPGFAPLVIDPVQEAVSSTPAARYGVMLHGVTSLSLPASTRLTVDVGERVFGGASVLGQMV